MDGAIGEVRFNGDRLDRDAVTGGAIQMWTGDSIEFLTPGGGGMGDPRERARARVEEDLSRGYISDEAAASLYGRELEPIADGRE